MLERRKIPIDEDSLERERNNVTHLKLIKSDGGNTTGNWLLDLPVGTRFAVQSQDPKNFMALDLELVWKGVKTAVLYELTTGQPLGGNGRVVAQKFTNLFSKVEDLGFAEEVLPKEQKETEEDTHGSGDRTDELEDKRPSGDVGDDARAS